MENGASRWQRDAARSKPEAWVCTYGSDDEDRLRNGADFLGGSNRRLPGIPRWQRTTKAELRSRR